VVDAVAEQSAAKVDVYGHSSGGMYAYGAATLTNSLRRLALYEGWPSVNPRPMVPDSFLDRLDRLLAEGNPEGVVETFIREVVQMSEDDLATYRSLATWPNRVAAAHTIPREMRTEPRARLDPQVAARIIVPVLMIMGEQSPTDLRRDPDHVASALPDARITVIEGQQHAADVLAPESFAELIIGFLGEER
jgi:pimeloyl-ACP methyl ester carboxylesterase